MVTSISKHKFVEDHLSIPEGVIVELKAPNTILVKGKLGELERSFVNSGVEMALQSGSIRVRVYGKGRRALAMLKTVQSHIRNMFIGVTEGYTYKLKIISAHFPMSVKVRDNYLLIENFAGEKVPRVVEIPRGVRVSVEGQDIVVSGTDKELVGLMAGRIEQRTKMKGLDPRRFLDGIYLYEKRVGIPA